MTEELEMEEFEIEEFERKARLYARKRSVFGEANALFGYCFQEDNGSVPQLGEARRYTEHFADMVQENLGLLFWGQSGNGKTFAAGCIANALCEAGRKVRMTTLGSYLSKLPGMTLEEREHYFTDLTQCDLLILDDFGMERKTDYAQEQVFNLIDSRYLAHKPLIVTTNLSLQELKSPTDITRQRIYDRVLELCVPVCFDRGSLRGAKAKEKMALYRQLTGKG